MTVVSVNIDGHPLGYAGDVVITHDRDTTAYNSGIHYGSNVVTGETITIDLNDFRPHNGEGVEKRWGIRDEHGKIEWMSSREAAESVFNYLNKQEMYGYDLVSQTVPQIRTVRSIDMDTR